VRDLDDNYETPEWCVRAIWPHVRPISGAVLDPCAGRGAIVHLLTSSLYRAADVYGCEIDKGRQVQCANLDPPPRRCAHADWLTAPSCVGPPGKPPGWPRLILTNPPYRLALPFVEKALTATAPVGGEVCMLLRLNFLGSQKRGLWLRDHLPDVYVLSERPSFTGKGTDATEYAWFVWGPKRSGRLHMLVNGSGRELSAAGGVP
jgi:hypothetical protein